MSNVLRLTGVTLPGTGYPTLKSFLDVTPRLPVTAGLLGLYYLRDSGGREIQNYVFGGAPLIKVGSQHCWKMARFVIPATTTA